MRPRAYFCRVKREIIETSDGSKTIRLIDWDEQYHSVHGALQEALHVFIQHLPKDKENLSVFEMGFGTGLNALLTRQWAQENEVNVEYHSLEKYPVEEGEWKALEYHKLIQGPASNLEDLHKATWEDLQQIDTHFSIQKMQGDLEDFLFQKDYFDVVFYDAFGPRVQPHLWTISCFEKMYGQLKEGGCLLTYCAKGQVRRDLQSAGFQVERLPGPPRKREMLKANKI